METFAAQELKKILGEELGDKKPILNVIFISRNQKGTMRQFKILISQGDDKPLLNISLLVAQFLGWKTNKDKTNIRVSGCGMDMAQHLIYSIICKLYPDNYWGVDHSDLANRICKVVW